MVVIISSFSRYSSLIVNVANFYVALVSNISCDNSLYLTYYISYNLSHIVVINLIFSSEYENKNVYYYTFDCTYYVKNNHKEMPST